MKTEFQLNLGQELDSELNVNRILALRVSEFRCGIEDADALMQTKGGGRSKGVGSHASNAQTMVQFLSETVTTGSKFR